MFFGTFTARIFKVPCSIAAVLGRTLISLPPVLCTSIEFISMVSWSTKAQTSILPLYRLASFIGLARSTYLFIMNLPLTSSRWNSWPDSWLNYRTGFLWIWKQQFRDFVKKSYLRSLVQHYEVRLWFNADYPVLISYLTCIWCTSEEKLWIFASAIRRLCHLIAEWAHWKRSHFRTAFWTARTSTLMWSTKFSFIPWIK